MNALGLAIFVISSIGISSMVSAEAIDCNQWNGVVDKNTTLKNGCKYYGAVTINKSHVTLDCNGAVIDGGRKMEQVTDGITSALRFEKLQKVTIKNCIVQNFNGRGINLRYIGNSYLESSYSNSPENIIIDNVTVWHNYYSGIYINAFSQNVHIKNSKIAYNGGVGIYLERESRYNTIEKSEIYKNSGEYPIWKSTRGFREGIAIDASANNQIISNTISENAAGAKKVG